MRTLKERMLGVCGLRDFNKRITGRPSELGYKCPKCGKTKTLVWSEYNTMIWCRFCCYDFPSCMCKENKVEGIYEYLDSVEQLIKRAIKIRRENEQR